VCAVLSQYSGSDGIWRVARPDCLRLLVNLLFLPLPYISLLCVVLVISAALLACVWALSASYGTQWAGAGSGARGQSASRFEPANSRLRLRARGPLMAAAIRPQGLPPGPPARGLPRSRGYAARRRGARPSPRPPARRPDWAARRQVLHSVQE
jgi:hypothetical protein